MLLIFFLFPYELIKIKVLVLCCSADILLSGRGRQLLPTAEGQNALHLATCSSRRRVHREHEEAGRKLPTSAILRIVPTLATATTATRTQVMAAEHKLSFMYL